MPIFLLTRILPALAAAALVGYALHWLEHRGYARAEAKYQAVMQQEAAARATVVTEQLRHNQEAEAAALKSKSERETYYAIEIAKRDADVDGLALRLRAASAIVRPSAVPKAGSVPSTGAAESCSNGEIDAVTQQVFDACKADAVALATLRLHPLCECTP